MSPDEHSVVVSLLRKIDLTLLENDIPLSGLIFLICIAECKKIVEKVDVKNFMAQILKLKDESTLLEKLQPCLSEAEAKVAMALIEGERHRGENILEILMKHQELNVLKIISVLSVMQDEKKFQSDCLNIAKTCLEVNWSVKDGSLFHTIMSHINSYIPAIFVYDGTSSPYEAIQELGSYHGIEAHQVIHIDHTETNFNYKG